MNHGLSKYLWGSSTPTNLTLTSALGFETEANIFSSISIGYSTTGSTNSGSSNTVGWLTSFGLMSNFYFHLLSIYRSMTGLTPSPYIYLPPPEDQRPLPSVAK